MVSKMIKSAFQFTYRASYFSRRVTERALEEPVNQQSGHIVRISAEYFCNSTGDGNNQHITILPSIVVIKQYHKAIYSGNKGQQSLKSLTSVNSDRAEVYTIYGSHCIGGD